MNWLARRLLSRFRRPTSPIAQKPFRPTFDTLEPREVPAGSPAYAVGAGVGAPPEVRLFDQNGGLIRTILAYDPGFTGGVRVAVGDLNSDGVADVVTAPGPGGGPHVRAFDGRTGATIANFFAYDPSFRGGVLPAVGPVGDTAMGIATGTDVGGGPHVMVFDPKGRALQSFMAFEDSFRGGVGVSLGTNRAGKAEVFAVPGEGGGPRVRSFSVTTATPRLDQLVFESDYRKGLAVSAGDWTGDGGSDVMVGARNGGGPRVSVIDGHTGSVVEDFFAITQDKRDGITPVAMRGPNGFVRLAAVTSDPEPWVRVMGQRADDDKIIEVDALGPFPFMGEGLNFSADVLDPTTKTQTYSIKAIDPNAGEFQSPPGTTTGLFEVRRKGDTSQDAKVFVELSGNATLTSDYTTTLKTDGNGKSYVTLGAYQDAATIKITAVDDATLEEPESVIATLTSVSVETTTGYELIIDPALNKGTVTVRDNDDLSLTAAPMTVWIDQNGSDTFSQDVTGDLGHVRFRRSNVTGSLSVNYSLSGTAKQGTDYNLFSNTITFPDGEDVAELLILPVDEVPIIPTTTVIVTLDTSTKYTITGPTTHTVSIEDSQPGPSVANELFVRWDTAQSPPVLETETAVLQKFTVAVGYYKIDTLNLPSLNWNGKYVLSGTGKLGVDYTVSISAVPNLPPPVIGENYITDAYYITITPLTDNEREPIEVVELGMWYGDMDGRTPMARPTSTGLIEDVRPNPVVSVQALDATSAELTQSTGSFRIMRNETSLQFPLTVSYEFNSTQTQGAALFGIDYLTEDKNGAMSETGTVTFPPGVRSLEIKLTPENDIFYEGIESARLTLLPNSANYDLNPTQFSATVAIVDDEANAFLLDDPFGLLDGSCSSCVAENTLESGPETCYDQGQVTSNRGDGAVRYADGQTGVTETDLTLSGPTSQSLGVARSWSNIPAGSQGAFLGNGWTDSYLPFLVTANDGQTVGAVINATSAYHFDYNVIEGTYKTRLYSRETLTYSPSLDEYAVTTPVGEVTRFYGFGTAIPELQRGRFKSRTDAAGHSISVYSSDSEGRPLELRQVTTVNGTTVTESMVYTYGTTGGSENRIVDVTVRRKLGTGAWQNVRSVTYAYYNASESHGNEGDLKLATRKDENGNAIDSSYYRYYTSNGMTPGGLKAVLNASAYARATFDLGNAETASDSALDDYADQWYEYDFEGRVTSVVSSGQGCSMCSAGQGTTEYTYLSNSTFNPGLNTWKYKTIETLADGNTRTVYLNAAKQVMLSVFEDTTTNDQWPTFHAYDPDGRRNMTANPSAIVEWDENLPDLMGLSQGAYSKIRDTGGTVEIVDWYYGNTATASTPGGAPGRFKSIRIRHGELGAPARESAVEYLSVAGSNVVRFVPAKSYAIRNQDGSGAAASTTTFEWGGSLGLRMDRSTTTNPIVTTAQNGSGVATSTTTVYDEFGRAIWSKDEAGFLSYTQYDPGTGAVIKSISDVNTSQTGDFLNLPSGWTTPSGGGLHLIHLSEVDLLGRTVKSTSPAGRIDYTVYKDAQHETRSYSGWDSANNVPTGPISISRDDLARGYSESIQITNAPSLSSGRPTGQETITGLVSLSRSHRNLAGQTVESDAYFNLTGLTYSTSVSLGTANTHFYRSEQDYTHRGWANRSITPLGTISRTVYDALGRAVSQWVGTNDTPTSGFWSPANPAGMVKVSETEYDNGGIGDGLATKQTTYPGLGASPRVTETYYDWRNRPVAVKSGIETTESADVNRPISYTTYDNLGRAVLSRMYDGDGVSIVDANTDGIPDAPDDSLLRAQSGSTYDELGRAYRSDTYSVSPIDGTVGTYTLYSLTWFDARGQVVKSSSPGGMVQKQAYDGLGRTTVSYVTDGGGDTGYADADDVTGDIVLEQSEPVYDVDGKVLKSISKQRFHDETGTGALGTATTGVKARVSYSGMYYDVGDRMIASVNVGTNGGSDWTRPSTVPSRSDTVLVTSFEYDSAGRQWKVIDPKGIESRTYFDDAGRTLKTIENYVDGVVGDDNDKTTEYTYNAAGMTTLTARLTGGAYQTTEWVYGITTAGGHGIDSNDTVRATRWPDPSTGAASASQEDKVTLNAVGQTVTSEDRNGTVHTLGYDILGRMISDTVTTLGTNIDGAVRRVETAYDSQGNAFKVTNYSATTGGSVVNEVLRLYNGLGQLTHEFQSHDGSVNPILIEDPYTPVSPFVRYDYSEMSGGANHSRLTDMISPNGFQVRYNYGTGLDNTISRLTSMKEMVTTIDQSTGSPVISEVATLESYAYLGAGTVVRRSHPQSGVDLTYVKLSGESNGDAGDQYTGLDRFGRIVDQRWITAANGVAVDRYQYTYDRIGNRLTESNSLNTSLNETYGYDSLNQLTNFSTTGTTKSWDFDALGNWDGVTTNSTTQTRTHNRQNEITGVSGATTPTFDANGNMTKDETGRLFVFDAWNRLVEVKNSSGTSLVRYEYDGLTRRIEDGTKDLYYSDQWQVIYEETSSDNYTMVWSPVYVDAMVMRSTSRNGEESARHYVTHDANFNVTAITNTSGTVIERYTYDPFGSATYRNASWTVISGSGSNWQYLHQGGRLNAETGLYSFRYREYSPTLGRWVTMDPIGFESGKNNLFLANSNDPVNRIDALGLYDTDVHFYMTYYIAQAIGFSGCKKCLNGRAKSVAYQISWANEYTDYNQLTEPLEKSDVAKRRKFHFRYRESESPYGVGVVRNSKYSREVALKGVKTCDPFLLGMGLHILQDSYSHEGFGPRKGHLIIWNIEASHNVDDPIYSKDNLEKAMEMAETTYYMMLDFYKKCCNQTIKKLWPDIKTKIRNIFESYEAVRDMKWQDRVNYRIRKWVNAIHNDFNVDVEYNEEINWQQDFESMVKNNNELPGYYK